MSNRRYQFSTRWLLLFLPLSLATLPLLAQQDGAEPGGDPLAAAKAKLMDEGQATLTEATALAEKASKGQALEVHCQLKIRSAPADKPSAENRRLSKPGEDDKRLMYQVKVYAKENVKTIIVDGLERKIVQDTPDKN